MAKKEIQSLTRTLAKFYKEAEETLSEAELALKDIALSEEEQKDFSEVKAYIDNDLTLLSVALSAAAQGKIAEVIRSKKEEGEAFLEPLHQAISNLSDESIDEETKSTTMSLIAAYNDKIDDVNADLRILYAIRVFANCPRKKEKRKRYVKALSLGKRMDLEHMIKYKIPYNAGLMVFTNIYGSLDAFRNYVKNALEETKESTAGDLAE